MDMLSHKSASYETASQLPRNNGETGIRTPDTGLSPYNGLANRRLQPLGHLSGGGFYSSNTVGKGKSAGGAWDGETAQGLAVMRYSRLAVAT